MRESIGYCYGCTCWRGAVHWQVVPVLAVAMYDIDFLNILGTQLSLAIASVMSRFLRRKIGFRMNMTRKTVESYNRPIVNLQVWLPLKLLSDWQPWKEWWLETGPGTSWRMWGLLCAVSRPSACSLCCQSSHWLERSWVCWPCRKDRDRARRELHCIIQWRLQTPWQEWLSHAEWQFWFKLQLHNVTTKV